MEMKFHAMVSVVEINKFVPNLCFSDELRMQWLIAKSTGLDFERNWIFYDNDDFSSRLWV